MSVSIAPLCTQQGWNLLNLTQLQAEKTGATLEQISLSLRKDMVEPELAAAITAAIGLRQEATSKFGDSARFMLFTRDGLEQATRLGVAVLHAHRLAQSGITSVADLGCGIGSDSLAFAGIGMKVLAVDKDDATAACAAVNLRSFPEATVECADITDLSAEGLIARGVQAAYFDPARRRKGTRVFDPEQWSPPLSEALSWQIPGLEVGIKVAPGIKHSALPSQYHAQWVSVRSELVEASLWSPRLSPEGPGRSAAVESQDGWTVLQDPAVTDANTPGRWGKVEDLADYLYEPNPAIIRAGLTGYLADLTGTHLLSEKIAYLSGGDWENLSSRYPQATAFLDGFRIVEECRLRAKEISRLLQQLGATSVEIKKRGVDLDPATVRRSLKLAPTADKQEFTVIMTRVKDTHRAIIAQRVRPELPGQG